MSGSTHTPAPQRRTKIIQSNMSNIDLFGRSVALEEHLTRAFPDYDRFLITWTGEEMVNVFLTGEIVDILLKREHGRFQVAGGTLYVVEAYLGNFVFAILDQPDRPLECRAMKISQILTDSPKVGFLDLEFRSLWEGSRSAIDWPFDQQKWPAGDYPANWAKVLTIFTDKINPHLPEAIVSGEADPLLGRRPLSFARGSRDELQAILQAMATLFWDTHIIGEAVITHATGKDTRHTFWGHGATVPYRTLGDFIRNYIFPTMQPSGNVPTLTMHHPSAHRIKSSYRDMPPNEGYLLRTAKPTAHEKASAHRFLKDWLVAKAGLTSDAATGVIIAHLINPGQPD